MESKFEVFTKEVIDKQFEEIVKNCTEDLTPRELMSFFHQTLVNRIMPAMIYDKDSYGPTLYRVTKVYPDFDPSLKRSYSYPPSPGRGRANIEGHPVFYASLDFMTALTEMKDRIEVDEIFYISKWKLKFSQETIAHHLILNSDTIKEGHQLNKIAKNHHNQLAGMVAGVQEELSNGFTYAVEKIGDLYMSSSEEMYHITAAYSHELLYSDQDRIDVPIICYPSVENHQNSINWAIHPRFVDSDNMQLEEVFEISFSENKIKENGQLKFNIHRKGFNKNNNIQDWKILDFEITEIGFDDLQVFTYSKELYKSTEASELIVINNNMPLRIWLEKEINNKDFYNGLSSIDIPSIEQENVITFSELNYEYLLWREMDLNAIEIMTPKGRTSIHRFAIPLKWRKSYVEIID